MTARTVQTTADQQAAIDKQVAYYSTPECPCAGLDSHRVYDAREWGDQPAGAVAVDFHYLYDEPGQHHGLETTVFATDGTILASQDFG